MPPPLMDKLLIFEELARLIMFVSRKTTTTVVSSWKYLRTPRSIFFRSENLSSLFLAASCRAAFTSFLALPYIGRNRGILYSLLEIYHPAKLLNGKFRKAFLTLRGWFLTISTASWLLRWSHSPSDANMTNRSFGSN